MTGLQKRLADLEERVKNGLLPGWGEELANDNVLDRKLKACHSVLVAAVNSDDEHAFERVVADWKYQWAEVNRRIAERYRVTVKPEDWELRYIKWMKIKFMRMTCSAGEFYLVPHRPNRRPRARFWYTVDEMIDMMSSPAIRAAIETFGELPVRPEEVGLGPGEQHFHIDFTELEPSAWFDVNVKKGWTIHGNKLPLGEVLAVDVD